VKRKPKHTTQNHVGRDHLCVGQQQGFVEREKFSRLVGGLTISEPFPHGRADRDDDKSGPLARVIVKFRRPAQKCHHHAAKGGGGKVADEAKTNVSELIRHPGVGIGGGCLYFLAVDVSPKLVPKILWRQFWSRRTKGVVAECWAALMAFSP
jgi:hypothetical protein